MDIGNLKDFVPLASIGMVKIKTRGWQRPPCINFRLRHCRISAPVHLRYVESDAQHPKSKLLLCSLVQNYKYINLLTYKIMKFSSCTIAYLKILPTVLYSIYTSPQLNKILPDLSE
jgi:hypothetical protein